MEVGVKDQPAQIVNVIDVSTYTKNPLYSAYRVALVEAVTSDCLARVSSEEGSKVGETDGNKFIADQQKEARRREGNNTS